MNLKYVCLSVLESDSKKTQEKPSYGRTCLQFLLPPIVSGRKSVARAEDCIYKLTSMPLNTKKCEYIYFCYRKPIIRHLELNLGATV